MYGYRNDPSMPPEVCAGTTPKIFADNPVGEGNTLVITMKGEQLTVELNGKKVLDGVRLPGASERGPIGLQHHGGFNKKTGEWSPASSLVQFQNVYVKRLDVHSQPSDTGVIDPRRSSDSVRFGALCV